MHAIELDAEPNVFEITLSCGSWLFSTFAKCFCAQAAVESAERELIAHKSLHDMHGLEDQAVCAQVTQGNERRFFQWQDGEWRFARGPLLSGSFSRKTELLSQAPMQRRAA
jgi:hypothetical protein